MSRPLAVDLFCGLGGWTEGLLAEGYSVIGFDCERHVYGEAQYPAQLVLQDVLTIHGAQFKDAALIVASPPCQGYSYRAMPWKRAKALPPPDNNLFEACFRIQREACEAAGRHIPLVVENVCGAQKWVGRARWHFGSFYLWGDVPALMPITKRRTKGPMKGTGNQLCAIRLDQIHYEDALKDDGREMPSGDSGRSVKGRSAALQHYDQLRDDIKQGGDWFNKASGNSISRRTSSRSVARKAASAHIAKIPLVLARHIARAWHP